jgi:hypothetical protein
MMSVTVGDLHSAIDSRSPGGGGSTPRMISAALSGFIYKWFALATAVKPPIDETPRVIVTQSPTAIPAGNAAGP